MGVSVQEVSGHSVQLPEQHLEFECLVSVMNYESSFLPHIFESFGVNLGKSIYLLKVVMI